MVDPSDSINPFPGLDTAQPSEAPSATTSATNVEPVPVPHKAPATWRRVSSRQWIRNFRTYISRLYTLPYKSCFGMFFMSFGYYPDMIDLDSYQRFIMKYPISTRKDSTLTAGYEHHPHAADTDLSSSLISTTDFSASSFAASGTDSNANVVPAAEAPRASVAKAKKGKKGSETTDAEAPRASTAEGGKKGKKGKKGDAAETTDAEAPRASVAEGGKKGKKGKKDEATTTEGETTAAEDAGGKKGKKGKKDAAPAAEAAAPAAEEGGKKGKKGKKEAEAPAAAAAEAPAAEEGKKGKKRKTDAAAAEAEAPAPEKGKKGKKGKEEPPPTASEEEAPKAKKSAKKEEPKLIAALERASMALEGGVVEEAKPAKGKGKKK